MAQNGELPEKRIAIQLKNKGLQNFLFDEHTFATVSAAMDNPQEDNGPDTIMSREEDIVKEQEGGEGKPTYKSWKKKYKKMKIKFDEAMRESKEFYTDEQRALKVSRRLAQEIDQIMDLLLDMNDSPQIPIDKRVDLETESPALPKLPPLVSDEELAFASEIQTPAGKAMYGEIRTMLDEKAAARPHPSSIPKKSLAGLIATIPHLTAKSPHVPRDLLESVVDKDNPAYLTSDQMDDYLYDIDASLGLVPTLPRPTPQDTSQDYAFGHKHSPYNWLRENVPKIFLQDGETSDKSHGKPGALRGAGKRASIPAPSQPDALEIVEEDGIGYDFSLGTQLQAIKGKRKREDDDVGYHPKKGSLDEGKVKKPRQARKRKSEGSDEKQPSARKRKVKQPSPSPDPGAHPFGPI